MKYFHYNLFINQVIRGKKENKIEFVKIKKTYF